MDALEALHWRVSTSKLTEPAPTADQCEALFKAALRAADHGLMRPWRFLVVQSAGLTTLGELFAAAARSDDPDLAPEVCESYRKMPLRAPMIIVVIASCRENPKVPEIEQVVSAGAAAQNMINAAYALGLGVIWRTGAMAYHPKVLEGLGLKENEKIVGYLYVGTPISPLGKARLQPTDEFFTPWPQQ